MPALLYASADSGRAQGRFVARRCRSQAPSVLPGTPVHGRRSMEGDQNCDRCSWQSGPSFQCHNAVTVQTCSEPEPIRGHVDDTLILRVHYQRRRRRRGASLQRSLSRDRRFFVMVLTLSALSGKSHSSVQITGTPALQRAGQRGTGAGSCDAHVAFDRVKRKSKRCRSVATSDVARHFHPVSHCVKAVPLEKERSNFVRPMSLARPR